MRKRLTTLLGTAIQHFFMFAASYNVSRFSLISFMSISAPNV